MGLPIFYIDSGKGGVGKSLFSLAAVDYLLENGKKVFLIDADIHSQDLFFAFERDRENVNAAIMDLTSSDGWLKLVEVMDGSSWLKCLKNSLIAVSSSIPEQMS